MKFSTKIISAILVAFMFISITPTINYSDNSIITAYAVSKYAPGKVKNLELKSKSTNSVSLKWSKISNASGYVVYKYIKSKNSYSKVGTTQSNSIKITDLKPNTKYMFAIRAYKKVNGKNYHGEYSSKLTVTTNKTTSKATTTKPNTNVSSTVYITPTGKKWHKSKECAGKNAIARNINDVKSYGPCKKCAQ